MPPFSSTISFPSTCTKQSTQSDVVTIEVGGQIFQTTKQTLTQSGPNSLFSRLTEQETRFIDRDPELFSILLSLLRTGTFPSKAKSLDLDELIAESKFYEVEHLLVNALSNNSLFEPFGLEKSLTLPVNGRDSPSAVSATSLGTLHVAHGSKITSFDWSLRRKSTILTDFAGVDSLLAISPNLAAAGAVDFSGLRIIDLEDGFVRESLDWENVTRSGSTVQGVGSGRGWMYVSFESGRRNSNSIVAYDLGSFLPVAEIGHSEIFGADLDSAIPAKRLDWVEGLGLLMAAGSHGSPSGVVGNVRLWDVRSQKAVWELKENVDCFSDIAISDTLSAIFKVGVNSGEVFYADLRMLRGGGGGGGGEGEGNSPWVCVGDRRRVVSRKKEGLGCKIVAQGSQVFVGRGRDIELWSEVVMGSLSKREDGLPERVFKKNVMGRLKDMGGSKVTNLCFGGNKMFVTRKDQQCVEVWQSSAKGF